MSVELSPDEARQTLTRIEDMVREVKLRQQDMRLRAEEMVHSTWLGGQAKRFGEAMQVHDDELTSVGNQLDHVVTEAQHKVQIIEAQAAQTA